MCRLRFKIVVLAYNALPWLEKALKSIEEQSYLHYDVCLIDDASTDPGHREVMTEYAERNGWKTIFNKKNQGALANDVMGINALNCQDEDVIVQLDGDDWFFNEWVLERLKEIYEKEDVWITHSQHLCWSSRALGPSRPTSWWTHFRRSYRKAEWQYAQLRTFKSFLWSKIRDEDLRDEDGNYFTIGREAASMYPMLEMAGGRVRFIPEIQYVYNEARPDSDAKKNLEGLRKMLDFVRAKRKYHAI